MIGPQILNQGMVLFSLEIKIISQTFFFFKKKFPFSNLIPAMTNMEVWVEKNLWADTENTSLLIQLRPWV